jgi:hypothetical protein
VPNWRPAVFNSSGLNRSASQRPASWGSSAASAVSGPKPCSAIEPLQMLLQRDGILQARRVDEAQRRLALVQRQRDGLDMAGRARPADTAPKSARRVSVRSKEVLPALVWPTTAMFSGAPRSCSGVRPH